MQHESTIFSTIRYIDRENFALDIEIFRNIEVSYYSPRLSAPRAVVEKLMNLNYVSEEIL